MKPTRIAARTFLSLAVALALLVPSSLDDGAMGETITTFTGGSSEVTISLTQGSQNTEASFTVPVDGTVTEATFHVTGMDAGNHQYPNRLQVHVGSVGNPVYAWAGRSYSPMGFQDRFTDMSAGFDMTFTDQGSNNSHSVRLPEGAKITSAEMRLEGLDYDAGWAYPVKLSHKVGNNVVPINTGGRPGPQLIDYDGDGDLDLLTGGYRYQSGNIQWIFLFENTGTKTSPKWEQDTDYIDISYNYDYIYSVPRLFDLDDDGDNDLVLGEYDGQVNLFWNTGTNANPTWTPNGTGQGSVFYGIDEGYYAVPHLADMDDDDDLDLAYGRYASTGNSNVGVSSYENTYSSGTWSWSTASFFGGIDTDESSAPWVVDYDGDGDNDIFVGNYDGTVSYYQNTGSKTNPKWTYNAIISGDIDIGTMARPTLGDLDDDGDLDMVVGAYDGNYYYYEKIISPPTDPAIDVGDDGDDDWSYSGELDTTVVATGLATELQSHLKGTYSHQDEWGNRFYDIPINFTSASAGILRVDQLRIVFEYKAKTIDFTAILNKYIKENAGNANDEGYLEVPIIVMSGSNGKLKLSDLKVVVDRAPIISDIPSTYAIDEDSKNLHLIDLTDHVTDDITPFADLKLKVEQLDQVGIVAVTLEDGRYVGVDAETGEANDNWHGQVSVKVSVFDGLGQGATSGVFTIQVRAVNDAPVLGETPPNEIYEDEPFEFRMEASDVDGDKLAFTASGVPEGMTITGDGVITWTPTNDDVGTHTITITVSDPGGLSVSLEWVLEVINVNDPPYFTGLPETWTIVEGKPETIDLSGTYNDVDNDLDELRVFVENNYITQWDEDAKLVTLEYPKESGMSEDELLVTVTDPEGVVVMGTIRLEIVRVEKLDLRNIPDQVAVETVPLTLDIKPYLYNVENWNNLQVSVSSAYCTVEKTKLTFLYTEGALLPADTEKVTISTRQGEEMASDDIAVSIKRLGEELALGIIPDQYVLEEEEFHLDVTPYILKAPDIDAVEVTVSGSPHVLVSGKVIIFNYPWDYGPEEERITVAISYKTYGDMTDLNVFIRNAEDDFVLTPIPDVTVTETVPETFNIKQYIKNANDIGRIDAYSDHPYADVTQFDVQLQYPAGFTEGEATRDDVVPVTITDGNRRYTRNVNVHVLRLGKELQLSGIGDRTVYVGDDLVIDVRPFLYNVDDIGGVTVSVSPDTYASKEGFVFTFNYPAIVSFPSQTVTFRAFEGEDVAEETITIYIEQIPLVFAFGPIGSITVLEDVPYVLDVEPYLKNMDPGAEYTVGVRSDRATVEGFKVTFFYDTEVSLVEVIHVNVTGSNGDFEWQEVFVNVKAVNDPPLMVESFKESYAVVEGEPALVIDLASHFTDGDSDLVHFDCNEDLVVIDNANGTATVSYASGATKPADLEGVVIYAFDPDEPSSMTESNRFNITFHKEGEDPGPGPGTDGPDVQDPSGGGVWGIVLLLVLVAAAGAGWMWYRRRKPAVNV